MIAPDLVLIRARGLCRAADALAQQREAGSAIALALDQLQSIHVPLDRAVAPAEEQGGAHRIAMPCDTPREASQFTVVGLLEPWRKSARIVRREQVLERAGEAADLRELRRSHGERRDVAALVRR